MITYPKIETLYDRDPVTFKVIPGKIRLPEFYLPKYWHVTEKVDGTNIRVGLTADGQVSFAGRTDKAQIPAPLLSFLKLAFPVERMTAAFPAGVEVVLFGEGYGEKIQSGGDYRASVGFVLFDVWVDGWWLGQADMQDVADKLRIDTVPSLDIPFMPGLVQFPSSADEWGSLFDMAGHVDGMSYVAELHGRKRRAEGIVARTEPLLFDRRGRRVMWKLKFKDF